MQHALQKTEEFTALIQKAFTLKATFLSIFPYVSSAGFTLIKGIQY